MKKLLLLFAVSLLGTYAFSQTQRLVLSEEFTGETCPPCATYNPAFNALLNANPTKIVSIKYQNNIPSAGPQIWAYNMTDCSTRQTYYCNNSSPNMCYDGGPSCPGIHPASFTQAIINSRYAVPSPFFMNVSHTLSAAKDSVYVTCTIKAAQAISGMTSLYARIVVVERDIFGYTSPNGENHYESSMRKMLPTAAGTLLAATWNNGDSIVINQSWKIAANPAGVTLTPNPNELAIVAFVQDDATKAVQQAAYSRPLLHNDAGVTAVTGIPAVTCSGSINPSVTIHNYAFDNLLSATVTLQVDAGPVQNFPWSGNIANGGNAVFAVPTVTLTTGSHTLLFGTTAPNTNADDNTVNDKKSVNATIMGATIPSPVVQGFVSAVWPTAWAIENVQNDTYKWARAAAGQSAANGSAKMDFYDSPNTNTDNFYSPLINFTNAILGASLDFYVSYAQYSTENDRLKISVSTDCGATWDTPIYNLAGSALATHVATTSAYTPAVPADWRHEVLSLNAYAGQTDILIQFSAISNYGNNLYIDDININDGTTGINLLNNTIEGINIYPNPSRGEFNVNVNFNQPQHLTIVVSNNIGEVVKTVEMKNISSDIIPINMVGMSKGTYIVTIKTDSDVVTKRISVIE